MMKKEIKSMSKVNSIRVLTVAAGVNDEAASFAFLGIEGIVAVEKNDGNGEKKDGN